jgi:hypothetical protein
MSEGGEYTKRLWLEEDLADDLVWKMQVKEVMFSGKSEYQEVDLINTGPFGKVRGGDASVCAPGPMRLRRPGRESLLLPAVHRRVRWRRARGCAGIGISRRKPRMERDPARRGPAPRRTPPPPADPVPRRQGAEQ